MESDKLNMNLQYFAEGGQVGSQSQPGAQGGDNGEGGQSTSNNTATNSGNQNGQSSQDFIKSLVDKVNNSVNQSQSNQNTNKNSDQTDNDDTSSKDNTDDNNGDNSSNDKTFTQTEVDKLLKDREFRARKKGIEEGKKAGKSSAEKYAQMTDEEKQQAHINDVLKENERLKAEKNRSDMRNEVLKQLKDTGYQFTNEDVDTLVSDDPDTTKHNVDNFKSMLDRVVKITKKNMFKNNQIPNSNTQQNNAAPSFGELVAKKTLGDPDRFKGKFFDK
ncbi:hypothetical protein LBSP_21220 [Lentilactobacillus buchneri subsp. silagei]|uniref:DUF4355 domain-containing protein n=1 Tax=Lentilactobacillus buchneri TaxID=1581 RepID=UPI0012E4093D|nr:DUF4355 domain-containing protein [Lentilactobacillus buchneri]GED95562.1 hypothetical protein LBSP_21220 [Lentilactobacillus buchneri subsp. silagei]